MPGDGNQRTFESGRREVLARALEEALCEPGALAAFELSGARQALDALAASHGGNPDPRDASRVLVEETLRQLFAAWGARGDPSSTMVDSLTETLWEHPACRVRLSRLIDDLRRPREST